MPTYEYGCIECGLKFECFATVADKEKGASFKCPKCGSSKIVQVFNHIAFRRGGGCGPNPPKGCCG